MNFKQINPSSTVASFVESFWIIEGEERQPQITEKIVPDGFPEIIIHYKYAYEVNIHGKWEAQEKKLLAGQLTHHFLLRNTGEIGMLGIKFKPAAIHQLWNQDMSILVDHVIPLPEFIQADFGHLNFNDFSIERPEKIIDQIQCVIEKKASQVPGDDILKNASDLIHEHQGHIRTGELAEITGISKRHLERKFKAAIGLSPKFYSRIVRFSSIFKNIESEQKDWLDLVYKSGFYDQSHFIKNFQEFTGEDPTKYGFELQNMANFHLKK